MYYLVVVWLSVPIAWKDISEMTYWRYTTHSDELYHFCLARTDLRSRFTRRSRLYSL